MQKQGFGFRRIAAFSILSILEGKKIILGISGGIAAYKAAFLIRLFKKAGAGVKVVGTSNAFEFISRVTLESLSENKVYDEVFGSQNDYSTEHVALADWGDVFVVAPATANIIGKLANGIADDALSTSLLAFNRQVFVAPAMNCKMLDHFAVQHNIGVLRDQGIYIIEPAEGYLACGYEGRGRMEEPDEIFRVVNTYLGGGKKTLDGKHILVTAGPTRENIDPVRYIGNHSSGLMGYAIARELASRGAMVNLVSGPTHLTADGRVQLTRVSTAEEMFDACMKFFPAADAAIMAAAVADYKPETSRSLKIKKEGEPEKLQLTLVPTEDILGAMGAAKQSQVLAGFALETDNEEKNAIKKLESKKLDFIVLNSLNDTGAGFTHDTNKITILDNNGNVVRYPLKGKEQVAVDIVDTLAKHMNI